MREKRLMHFEESKITNRPVLPVVSKTVRSPTSPLAVHPDKFTYTFINNNEVISIHYDRIRNEIFYQGHNVKNLSLNENNIIALRNILNVLNDDEEGKHFIKEYQATLDKLLADNK